MEHRSLILTHQEKIKIKVLFDFETHSSIYDPFYIKGSQKIS